MAISPDDHTAILARPVDERIRYLRQDCWMEFPYAAELMEELEWLLAQPKSARPESMLLIAESGMGKSAILKELKRRHPSVHNDAAGSTQHPIIYVEMPSPVDVNLLLQETLKRAGCPVRYRQTYELKTFFEVQLQRLLTEMIVVDEVQRLAFHGGNTALLLCESLKWMSSALQIPVVAAGTEQALQYFEADHQLARRFTRCNINSWDLNAGFQQLVFSVLSHMPMRDGFDKRIYTEPASLQVILKKSEGVTGGVFKFLRRVAAQALMREEERLELDHILGNGP